MFLKDSTEYKSVKSRIDEWVNTMQEKQQEWLLVHVIQKPKGDNSRDLSSLLKLSKNVPEKIRSDFDTGKRQR